MFLGLFYTNLLFMAWDTGFPCKAMTLMRVKNVLGVAGLGLKKTLRNMWPVEARTPGVWLGSKRSVGRIVHSVSVRARVPPLYRETRGCLPIECTLSCIHCPR